MKIINSLLFLALANNAQAQMCEVCPSGISNPTFIVPESGTPESGDYDCSTLIPLASFSLASSDDCKGAKLLAAICCPADLGPPVENACDVCPVSGTSNPSAVIPDSGGITCEMVIGLGSQIDAMADDCASYLFSRPSCCPPVTPCSVCPSGVTAPSAIVPGVGVNCSDVVAYTGLFEESEEQCEDEFINYRALCCPADIVPAVDPCKFCESGVDDPAIIIPDSDGMTCGLMEIASKQVENSDETCATGFQSLHSVCCPPKDPCTICPNGVTADPDTVVPGVGASCSDIVFFGLGFEKKSDMCTTIKPAALMCCPSIEPVDKETKAPTPELVSSAPTEAPTPASTPASNAQGIFSFFGISFAALFTLLFI